MNFLWRTVSSTRDSRQKRPAVAWVERLERRSLLTLQVTPIASVAGQGFNGAVATFATGDVQGTIADFNATIYWTGALNLVTTGIIAPNAPGSFVVYSSNIYARPGSYPVNVVLTGANNSSAQAVGTSVVADAPLTTNPVTISTLIQTSFSGVVATFQTTNFYASTTDFTASIKWGDGANLPTAGVISSNGFNSFSVVGEHVYTAAGTLPITVTIVSPGGQTDVVSSTAVVTAPPVSVFPTQVIGNAGQALSGVTVATFLDPSIDDSASDFRAVVDWGDGTINVGTIVNQGDGGFTVTGNHTYMASGSYNLNIQVVRAADGQTATTTSTAQIGSPSPASGFTGGLASVPANGPFISSGYATTNRPTFDGTAAAFAIVQLFAQPLNVDGQLSLGETVADSNGNWSLATNPLAAGGYVITAKVTPPAGYPSLAMALSNNNGTFFIDRSPPSEVSKSQLTAVGAERARPAERPRTRGVAFHRAPRPHRARVARSVASDGLIRPSHTE